MRRFCERNELRKDSMGLQAGMEVSPLITSERSSNTNGEWIPCFVFAWMRWPK